MKIDNNDIFLKNVTNASTLGSAKDGVSANRSASDMPAVAGQMRPPSATAMLSSTNGDFAADRVARIRESINAGSYQVNTTKIADSLLDTVRDLLGRNTP